MTTKNPVTELMVPLTWAGYKIRIWWTHDGSTHAEIEEFVRTKLAAFGIDVSDMLAVAKRIAAADDAVAAVEVLHQDGQGVVYYPDWK